MTRTPEANLAIKVIGALGIGLALGACGQASAPDTATASQTQASLNPVQDVNTNAKPAKAAEAGARTRKPGALVDFAYEFRFPPEVGEANVVTVTARHGYEDGTMVLTASADEGLSLFSPTTTHTVAMAGAGEEDWELSFEPVEAGIAYINIAAEVTGAGRGVARRSYAIRVDTREASQKATLNQAPVDEVIMEAEETISE